MMQNDLKWHEMMQYDTKWHVVNYSTFFGFQNDWNEQMVKNCDESYETQSEYYDSESKRSRRQKSKIFRNFLGFK